jgi:hypothetical protein
VAWNPYPTLPAGAVRDLLGITRALYRLALEADPRDPGRLQALEQIGRDLRAALREARTHPGTIQHQNAWASVERASHALQELVGAEPALTALVAATARLFSRPGSMV